MRRAWLITYKSTFNYSFDEGSEPEVDNDFEGFEIGGNLLHIWKYINNQESHGRTVSIHMGDADNGIILSVTYYFGFGGHFAVWVTDVPISMTRQSFLEWKWI